MSAGSDDHTRSFFVPDRGMRVAHYELRERLGSGGMGDVFLAQDTTLNRQVAIKFLSQALADNPDAKMRFLREAQSAAALNHPNIVTIYEAAEFQGRPFIAMEHVSGRSLKEVAREQLPVERILALIIQIGDGLGKAHQSGIVHRDIKPANIVVDSDNRARILDFGLASLQGSDQITRAGSTLGTVAYMSPEQARGQAVDARSDIFSLGIVLYELLAGRQPFKRDNDAATLMAILNDEPESIFKRRPDLPAGIQQIVERALRKDVGTRYQSALAMIVDLRHELKLLVGDSASATIVSRVQPARGNGRKLGMAVIVVVVLLIAVFVLRPWNLRLATEPTAEAAPVWLAIMYFDNLSDPADNQRLGEIVTNLLITDLSESAALKVVSSQRLYDIVKNLGKEGERVIDRQMASEIAKRADARWMLTGSILQSAPEFVVTAQLVDVQSGGVIASERITGSVGEKIFAVTERLGQQLRANRQFPAEITAAPEVDLAIVSTRSAEAYRFYLEGMEFQNRFYFTEADTKFREALKLDSSFAMPLVRLAWNSRDAVNSPMLARAMGLVEHATTRDQALIRYFHARFFGKLRDAIAVLETAIIRFPDDKELLFLLSQAAEGNEEAARGRELLNRVLELDPMYKLAWNQLAYNWLRSDILDSALYAVGRYIAIAPEEANPYDTRGDIFMAMGKPDSAIVAYRHALKIKPDFSMLSTAKLAQAYTTIVDIDLAQQAVQRALTASNAYERIEGRFYWVELLALQGKFWEAIRVAESFRRADQEEGNSRAAFDRLPQLATLCNAIGERQQALRYVEEIIGYNDTLQPPITVWDRAPITVTRLLWPEGRSREIDNVLEAARSEATDRDGPRETSLNRLQGTRALLGGDYAEAVRFFQLVSSRRKQFSAYLELGVAYLRAERYREALASFDKARHRYDQSYFSSVVDNLLFNYYLGQTLEALGETQAAITAYDDFVNSMKGTDTKLPELAEAQSRLRRLRS